MSNHWEEWLVPTSRQYARAHWTGRAQHRLRQLARAFNLPARLVLAVPPVPAKPSHRRRYGRG